MVEDVIQPTLHQTPVSFGLWFGQAQLRDYTTLDESIGSGSGESLERGIQARKETLIAMKLLSDCMGPIVWEVIGNSCSLCDQVSWQTAER